MADSGKTPSGGLQGVRRGRHGDLRALYTPDVVHRQPGNNQTSGEHKGVDNVMGLYGQLFELSGGTFRWTSRA